jgi:signal transduction histidine kinase
MWKRFSVLATASVGRVMSMSKSLSWKLTLAFILVAFTTAALVALFIRITSTDRLTSLLIDQQKSSMEQSLVQYYETAGSWGNVQQDWRQIEFQSGSAFNTFVVEGNLPPEGPVFDNSHHNLFGLADSQGNVIVSVDPGYPAGTQLSATLINDGTPIEVNGAQVGTILMARQFNAFNPAESRYLQRTNEALLMAIGVALLVALVIGYLLTRTLTRPLKALTSAAQNIASGQLDQQVDVKSKDEIGQLAESFNRMSQEVARVNQMRRQMTADIAHDLRTPLTVIAGYIESMRDGVLKATPERLDLIYSEIERLQTLVGDLRMLSQADSGELPLHFQKLSPRYLLKRAAELFQHHADQQQVTLKIKAAEDLPKISVDEDRMMQVLDNLVSNALRYTPSGGRITLAAQKRDQEVEITIQDNGSGIPPAELPQIFDRFHRSDKSRHSENGESGLGLAIVKALVESHHGRVWADSTPGKGTTIHIALPI